MQRIVKIHMDGTNLLHEKKMKREREKREVFFIYFLSSAYSVFAGMVGGHGERREICTEKRVTLVLHKMIL